MVYHALLLMRVLVLADAVGYGGSHPGGAAAAVPAAARRACCQRGGQLGAGPGASAGCGFCCPSQEMPQG